MKLYPDAINAYLEDDASGLTTATSRRTYGATLRMFAAEAGVENVEDVTQSHLVWFLHRDVAPSTKVAYRTRLRGFFTWAAWKELIDSDPAAGLKRAVPGNRKAVRRHHWLSAQEVLRVLAAPDRSTVLGRRDLVALRLGFTCGLRRAEIAKLQWTDVDLPRRQLRVVGKGDRLATVFLTDATLSTLSEWREEAAEGLQRTPNGDPVVCRVKSQSTFNGEPPALTAHFDKAVHPSTINNLVSRVSQAAGVTFKPHDMRRSFAGLLHDKAGIEVVSAALRHADLGTTQRYLESRQDAAFQAVKDAGFEL